MASEYVGTEYQHTQFYKTNTTGHITTYRSRYSKVGDSYTPLFSKDKIKSDWKKKFQLDYTTYQKFNRLSKKYSIQKLKQTYSSQTVHRTFSKIDPILVHKASLKI